MTVEPTFADWLGSDARYVEAATGDARWSDRPLTTQSISPLAERAAAIVEAARQGRFVGTPLAVDVHAVSGLRRDLFGRLVTLAIDQLGYDAGVPCFVIGYKERDTVEMTDLTVLRRL